MLVGKKLEDLVQQYAVEEEKFSNGNKTAGTRARKLLMDIKTTASERRKAITAEKNAE